MAVIVYYEKKKISERSIFYTTAQQISTPKRPMRLSLRRGYNIERIRIAGMKSRDHMREQTYSLPS